MSVSDAFRSIYRWAKSDDNDAEFALSLLPEWAKREDPAVVNNAILALLSRRIRDDSVSMRRTAASALRDWAKELIKMKNTEELLSHLSGEIALGLIAESDQRVVISLLRAKAIVDAVISCKPIQALPRKRKKGKPSDKPYELIPNSLVDRIYRAFNPMGLILKEMQT